MSRRGMFASSGDAFRSRRVKFNSITPSGAQADTRRGPAQMDGCSPPPLQHLLCLKKVRGGGENRKGKK